MIEFRELSNEATEVTVEVVNRKYSIGTILNNSFGITYCGLEIGTLEQILTKMKELQG